MRKAILLFIVATVALAGPALAQSVVSATEREAIRGVPDKWGIGVGSFWQTFDSKVRLNGTTGTGNEINFEKDLSLDKNVTSLQFSAFYRFGDHARIDIGYVPWSREKTKSITREIHWGDNVYEAGVSLTAKAKAQMVNVIYKYSFVNNGKVTFGLNGGVSSLWTTTSLSGKGTITGGGNISGTLAESKNVIFPIPVLGLHFDMTLAKRLVWRADGNFFAAKVSGYDGNLHELGTSIEYFFTRNVGLGAGFQSTMYNVTKTGSRGGDFNVKYGFSGVNTYLSAQF